MALTFKNFLVPLDGSAFAERALPYAQQLARECGATLHLLSVAEGNPDTLERIIGFTWIGQERRIDEEEAALSAYLEGVVGRISAETNTPLISEVVDGDAIKQIMHYAESHGCDMIIVATHGRSDIAQIVVGSLSEDLVRESSIPVMLIR